MRHATPRTGRLIALVALPVLLACATSATAQTPNPTPTPNPTYQCAGRIAGGLRNFTTNYLQALADCQAPKPNGAPCTVNSIQGVLNNAIKDLEAEVDACKVDGLINLCPAEGDTAAEVKTALTGPSGSSFRGQITKLVEDLFVTSTAGCTRPSGNVSSNAAKCASKIADAVGSAGNVENLEQCFFSCERARILNPKQDLCVDDVIGEPIKDDVIACQADELSNFAAISDRCSTATLAEIGCPLGTDSPSELLARLEERLATLAQQINLDVFHSDCRGTVPGEPTSPVPADVTLLPSNRKTKVTCGQTIDNAFLGSDRTINFDSDLDCGPSKTPTDGLVVAVSGVKLNGRVGKVWSIRGPQRSSLRTGAGIKLAPGVARTEIRNFKAIENFAVGILDADDGSNKKLVISKTTVRRNVAAGLRLRSARALVDTVTADKNGIGFDLSGDGIKVKGVSAAKGSVYPPKTGIQLGGVDKNANGSVVQLTAPGLTVELNGGVGIHVVSGAHLIGEAKIQSNVGNGIEIDPLANGSQVKLNTLKFNAAGIVVNGDQCLVDGNTLEENLGDGIVVGGASNTISNNDSGAKTDRGNGGAGYHVEATAIGTILDTNSAEANLGSGYVIEGTPTELSSNTAEANFGHGFQLLATGVTAQDNAAEGNNQSDPKNDPFHEWVFVAGQVDGDGNKAGGDTIGLPSTAGFCDTDNDCPVPK
ncbi:right-handed parallel beta-helix repeat-containing protein [Candidatus Binatia bacterium]|nr:right-handed parallel beta-helix repeat-containing protein [Candidatus Binatia bacterium]